MSTSLKNSLTTSKVDTSKAAQAYSDRQMNPLKSNVITRNMNDTYGRSVTASSLFTARRGGTTCSQPMMELENSHRPSYSSFLNLQGLKGSVGSGYDTGSGVSYSKKAVALEHGATVKVEKTGNDDYDLARMMQSKFSSVQYV
jgi:hypothetical protein